jgi:short-subunit dehydrogenase
MIPQRSGKIISIASMFSFLGGQWSPAYAATKHGIVGFT